MKKKTILIFLIILVVAMSLFVFFFYRDKKQEQEKIGYCKYSISGEVDKVNESRIVLKRNITSPEDSEEKFEYKEIVLNKITNILKLGKEGKSREEFDNEYGEFEDRLKYLDDKGIDIIGIEAPSWQKTEKISADDIRVGQEAEVYVCNGYSYASKIIIRDMIEEAEGNILLNQEAENDIYDFQGKILNIDNSLITLLELDPTATSTEDRIEKININDDTKIYNLRKKSEEEFNKESEDFLLILHDNPSLNTAAPSWFEKELKDTSFLSVGQEIGAYYGKTGVKISSIDIFPIAEEEKDSDNDGLTDDEETNIYNTDPNNPDTDGDGYFDGDEVKNGYNPNGEGVL